MRVVLIVPIAVGCSFQPVTSSPQPGQPVDGAASGGDAARSIDAPVMTDHDAPVSGSDAGMSSTWPCGTEPAAPPASVSVTPTDADLTMTSISLSGSGQRIVASAGATLGLSLHFTLTDKRCDECIDQLEVGWMQGSSGPRSGCAWDGGVPNPNGVTATVTDFTIAVPTTAGSYDLRTNIGQNTACGTGSWWAGEVPAADTTIAILCVE